MMEPVGFSDKIFSGDNSAMQMDTEPISMPRIFAGFISVLLSLSLTLSRSYTI
jgi:hypothetical protein